VSLRSTGSAFLAVLSIAGAAAGGPVTFAASGSARLASSNTAGHVAWVAGDLSTAAGCISGEIRDFDGRRLQQLGPPSGSRCRLGVRDASGAFVDVSGGSAGPVVVSGTTALVGVAASSNPGIAVELLGIRGSREQPGRRGSHPREQLG